MVVHIVQPPNKLWQTCTRAAIVMLRWHKGRSLQPLDFLLHHATLQFSFVELLCFCTSFRTGEELARFLGLGFHLMFSRLYGCNEARLYPLVLRKERSCFGGSSGSRVPIEVRGYDVELAVLERKVMDESHSVVNVDFTYK